MLWEGRELMPYQGEATLKVCIDGSGQIQCTGSNHIVGKFSIVKKVRTELQEHFIVAVVSFPSQCQSHDWRAVPTTTEQA